MTKVARAWPLLAHWTPPLVLGGFSLFEIWGSRIFQAGSFYGPAVVHTLGVLVMVAGLSVRIRAPGLCLVAVMADGVLEWAYARGASSAGGQIGISSEWFIAMLIAFYAVGAHRDLRPAAVRLAAALPVLVALKAVDVITSRDTVGDAVGIFPFVFGLWAAGVAVRRMRLRASKLEGRVDVLARERDEKARQAATEE